MPDLEMMDDAQYIFGAILVVANRMDTLLERALAKYDVTSKQWFLLIMLSNMFDAPPTIKELAKEMGSSHQNIKQVALKLQEKGLLKLEKDSRDMRATRLCLTEKNKEFWAQSENEGRAFVQAFNKGVDKEELTAARSAINKFLKNLDTIEEAYQ